MKSSKSSRDNLKEIGERIKAIRRELRVNQKEMAEALEIPNTYLSEIESGKRSPGHSFFYNFSGKYNVSLDYLFHGKGEMFWDTRTERDRKNHEDVEDIKSIDDVVWYMENSDMFYHQIMGFAFKLKYDYHEAIKKEIEKKRKAAKK